ncbi:MAG TPA: hypothetical protein PL078_02735 [Bacillota bacterium]|jgi:hypothetical protein|nr:hypothetical protein [Peptococcaceae bacterium MAG4]NLW37925.1 hypothetical protein [Peptococcaceae bacterium]HPU35161.1 hypothetical protein [Bacillota bacterium]HPZ42897.1 hypothetical protein [Bacillota bacterium]HQD75410.1 hypothetical protein [Bacillota bacterium]
MDNARLLDERLRRIIREISGRTGGEIRKDLLQDFGEHVRFALEEHTRRETSRLLLNLKRAIDNI